MKYIGRITATLPFFIISLWLLQHTYFEEGLIYFIISSFIAIVGIVTTWALGGQYDKARFYYRELSESKKELQDQKEFLQQIFDSVDATIWSNDLVNQRVYVSKGIEKLSGYTVQQFYGDYSFWLGIFHPEDSQKALEFYERVLSGESSEMEVRFINVHGEAVWVYFSGTPIFKENSNEVVKINGVVVDISARKKTEAKLQESESRYRSVVDLSPNMILIHQKDRIVYGNNATVQLLGVNHYSELLGRSIYDFLDPSEKKKAVRRVKEILQNSIASEYIEYKIVRPSDGKYIYLEMLGKEINFNGEPAIMIVAIDVTAKKEYQENIKFMAYHDALTGLPNRHMYNEYLEKSLERSRKHNQILSVMFIDLDRFKFINDTMGHDAGDELLKLVSVRLRESVRNQDFVSRLGGDEFAILMEDADEATIVRISNKIIRAFTAPFMIENKKFYTTPSIGISLFPQDGQDKETLNSKADTAMYLAKKSGKNNFKFYVHEQGDRLDRKFTLEQNLKHAIEHHEFYLEYQPKLELQTEHIYGVEALVRWNHPELGIISPLEFIPIAEESNLIVPLGGWILQEAGRQSKKWHDAGIKVKMAVNVSAKQFEDPQFVETVHQVLTENQIPPHYLGLEITESVMQNINQSSIIIQDLKKLGVKISIDDFGTGYSSLSVLSKLPIDFVKIDKSFVHESTTNPNAASLVKTIVEMGKNLQFELIAEGIEKKEQAEFLIENGCYRGQGYFYSPPLSLAEVELLLYKDRTDS
jgi:diguanylate cyclase (GGDEF)-like protein/PAS domain S-box-containing protein